MSERKPHIVIEGFAQSEDYQWPGRGPEKKAPRGDRTPHGQALAQQYSNVQAKFDELQTSRIEPITEDKGIYVELTSLENERLNLNSIDNKTFRLSSCKIVNNKEIAVIFIHESKRQALANKISEYLDTNKDSKSGPRNFPLLDNIESIKIADLRSFFTDDLSEFPADLNQETWWEIWLKRASFSETQIKSIGGQLCERIGGQLGNTSLTFFDNTVLLIKASANQLETSLDLVANLEEVRLAKDTPSVIVDSSLTDQTQWVEDISGRLRIASDISTTVCILDAGVNYNHPLLKHLISQERSENWINEWPHYEEYSPLKNADLYHGSLQAGLSVYGELMQVALSDDEIQLNHGIESARILPPTQSNSPELYGDITVDTALKHEIARPDFSRVYSLAVTAPPGKVGGQPSSWSAAVDSFAFGKYETYPRLVVISAGNNPRSDATLDNWETVAIEKIENPSQAWNALTVGAYTELTTNNDPALDGWSPFADSGSVSPHSTSSEMWEWKRQAPYKPDIVMEGGNKLMSPNKDFVSNDDQVSLLTTSGQTSGQLFDVSFGTSAACALASRMSAILMADYADYWPETIRGLIVHSAEWTERMNDRYQELLGLHTEGVAKESMLRSVGYGAPSLERARYSAENALTLIAQDTLYPFKTSEAKTSNAPVFNEMHFYELPWPIEELQRLPAGTPVTLKVTLSYFIEPNPGRRGYRNRYSYQSHGLRFEVRRPGQSEENFLASINKKARKKTPYDGKEGDTDGWFFKPKMRTRGTLHHDIWNGDAAALADLGMIAIVPVGGWWNNKTSEERWLNSVRYSLIISIETEQEDAQIYTAIENLIQTVIET